MQQSSKPTLPSHAHRPGRTRSADHAPLEAAKALVPGRFGSFVPVDDPAFRYGLVLHDAGFFWEAHEVWEAVWMAGPQNGRDRLALRALIQIANAGLKRELGQPRAEQRLIAEAKELLEEMQSRAKTREDGIAGSFDAEALMQDCIAWSNHAGVLELSHRFGKTRAI